MIKSFGAFLLNFFGSRAAIAVFAAFFIAFAAHAATAPHRLPPIRVPTNLNQLGLAALTPPPPPEIGLSQSVRERLDPAIAAAARERAGEAAAGVRDAATARLDAAGATLSARIAADPALGRLINAGLAAAALLGMFVSTYLYAKGQRSGRIRGGEMLSEKT